MSIEQPKEWIALSGVMLAKPGQAEMFIGFVPKRGTEAEVDAFVAEQGKYAQLPFEVSPFMNDGFTISGLYHWAICINHAAGRVHGFWSIPVKPGQEVKVVKAPFTEEQLAHIQAWQSNEEVHPMTCSNDTCPSKTQEERVMKADTKGLACPCCGYRQDWAPDFIAARKD